MRSHTAYRKGKGQSIGIPPFGTIRNDDGYLIPTPYGAWLLPDGSFQVGKGGDEPPHPDAVWRSYYECARLILEVYSKNLHGYDWIAQELNRQGWVFRYRLNNPRPLKLDDVRRVTSAWREYAGLVLQGKARDRIAAKLEDPTSVLYDTGRAVFELDLLQAVAEVQETRSVVRRATGTVRVARIFPLSELLYCARCDEEAMQADNPGFRSRMIGQQKRNQAPRYRHSERRRCGCVSQSVVADEAEDDFRRLVDTLQVRPEAIELMAELAIQSQFGVKDQDESTLKEQKKVAIARHRRALKNNLMLFQDGEIDDEEYYRQKDHHQRQIAYWEARTTDKQKMTLELTTCMEMVRRLKEFWNYTTGEDRKLLAHSLFDEVVYDLDSKRIVDFTIKGYAEPFMVLRAALYEDEMGEEMKNRFNSGLSSRGTYHSPNGLRAVT